MAGAGQASEYSHRIWRIEDGLPQNRIRAISQTPDGYLWIGTSEGLARFDGFRFTIFDRSNTPALRDDSILALRIGRDGTLWIGTQGGGLVRYNGGAFHGYPSDSGLTNGFVRSIWEDRLRVVWVGTDRGLFRLQGERFVRLDGTPEIPLASVGSITEDEAGRIWATSSAGLLTMRDGKLVQSHPDCPGMPVLALSESLHGSPWALNPVGASRFRNGCAIPERALPAIPIRSLTEGSDGNFWIGTLGRGLLRFANGRQTLFTAPSVLPDSTVNAVFEDHEQNLWVGCEDGLVRLSKSFVANVGSAEGLEDDNVLTVYPDAADNLWVATLTGQLYRVAGGSVRRQTLPSAAANLRARTAFRDRDGTLWLGTSGGLVRLHGNSTVVYSKSEGLRSNTVRQILQDRAGAIWIALDSGLSRFDGHGFGNYYLEDGLSYPSTRCMISDDRGDILIGTDGGLNRIHEGRIVRDSEFAALAKEKIWAIYQDPDGALWLGTRGSGLMHYRSGKLFKFTSNDGLPSNTIYQILDNNGKLWLSTSSGIVSVDRGELEAAANGRGTPIHAIPYGTADGMATSQMNGGFQPAGGRTSSGDLWFPTVKGVVRIDPLKIPSRKPMPVLIERVLADGKTVPLGGTVTLPPGHGKIEIDFTLCDLVAPQRVGFRYKLENFDDNWAVALRTRSAYYTNLPPGSYQFRVTANDPAASSSNVSEATLAFTLRPSFYQTGWFYGLLAIAAAASIWAGFALYARQTRERYALLLAERTRLAREMHDTVIQGCVGVSTLLEASAGYRRVDAAEADKLVDQARTEVTNTLDEAREAVWDLRHGPAAESSIAMLFRLARKLGGEHRIQIETEIVGKGSLAPEMDRAILLVGREALRNAVTHAHPGRITVRVVFGPSEVDLEVADDGEGFAPEATGSEENKHFGLVGMRERVEESGGTFSLSTAPGQGTRVIARMPLT